MHKVSQPALASLVCTPGTCLCCHQQVLPLQGLNTAALYVSGLMSALYVRMHVPVSHLQIVSSTDLNRVSVL